MKIRDGWLLEAEHLVSPNSDHRPPDELPSLLVVHNISLPPGQFGGDQVRDFFTNNLDVQAHPYFQEIADMQVSAHLLIDRLGHITQFVSFLERAWHAGASCFAGRERCNDFSIGIELEGTDTLPYTDRQYQVLAQVTIALMREYPDISVDRIVGHCDIAPGRKTDPGSAFDWHGFRRLLPEP
ncbi:MAG: N-acetyl-anhydromuranmyl-L-alanine amidase [Gammaproteobacteria bacterium BRH_c0]|nr:MAG: N-acetyl-anhydromuranmyl-L-alanine amidase [Gammaproteobacteria bacterium BRH_c0]